MGFELIGDGGFWWEADSKDVAQRIQSHISGLRNEQRTRIMRTRDFLCLYGDLHEVFGPGSGFQPVSVGAFSYNVVKSCCDTAHAKFAGRSPLPKFVTSGGDYSMKLKAKKLSRLVDGTFYDIGLYEDVEPIVRRFAQIDGAGFMKVHVDWTRKKVCAENVFPWEIIVDDQEAMYGKPRSLFQTKVVSKHQLAKLYKKHKTALMDVNPPADAPFLRKPRQDQVELVFAWHLPSYPGAGDGRYVMVCGDVTIVDEEHTRDGFPFAVFYWQKKPAGFWGTGLPEEIAPLQKQINIMLRAQQRAIKLGSAPKFVYEQNSINPSHIDDEPGALPVQAGAGFKPGWEVAKVVAPDLEKQIEVVYAKAFELTGISRISAQGSNQLGANASGAALREFYDQTSERFASVDKNREKFFLDAARLVIAAALEIAEKEGTYPVKNVGKKSFFSLDWKDMAGYDEEDFVLKLYNTNVITTHPAGRIQTIRELMDMGLIGPDDGLQALDFPDTEKILGRKTAKSDHLDRLLEKMLEHEPIEEAFTQPEPYDDLAFNLEYMKPAYLVAQDDGVPEERLQLIRDFIDQTQDWILKAQAGQPQPESPQPSPEPQEQPAPVGLPPEA